MEGLSIAANGKLATRVLRFSLIDVRPRRCFRCYSAYGGLCQAL